VSFKEIKLFIRDANVEIRTDGKKRFFFYEGKDLDKDPLVLPTMIDDMLGTVELTTDRIILHPQNGGDASYSVDDFLKFISGFMPP
jgi:hypothetical protein